MWLIMPSLKYNIINDFSDCISVPDLVVAVLSERLLIQYNFNDDTYLAALKNQASDFLSFHYAWQKLP